MQLGLSEVFDEWFDQHRRLPLANKWRSCSNYRFSTTAPHRPEKKPSKLANEPLEQPVVKAELDKGHEEYDRL